MRIAVVCITWNRPRQLGQMIRCFERQTHYDREMVILDDAGQYEPTRGDGWQIHSSPIRFASIGEKRNAAAKLISRYAKAIAVWDDDDLYMPWALEATNDALHDSPMSRPSRVLHPDPDWNLQQHDTGGLFHSGWGYRTTGFFGVRGYPPMNCGEDQELLRKFINMGWTSSDPIALGFQPFLVYNWSHPETPHISVGTHSPDGMYYQNRRQKVTPTDIRQWIADPPVMSARILPGVHPRVFDPHMHRFPVTGYQHHPNSMVCP
jgi:hypothetical protein